MFTGLIETIGTVRNLATGPGAPRLSITTPHSLAERLTEGASIAVNGVCLTALDISSGAFSADLAAETVSRTTLANLSPGSIVNLELPTPAGAPLGGHVVQGHVDGVAQLVSLRPISPEQRENSDWEMLISVPADLAGAIVPQGSIATDGISLTVAEIKEEAQVLLVRIAIIPHTYAVTNLRALRPGARVNIETDVLAKYAAQRKRASSDFDLTLDYLLRNGY